MLQLEFDGRTISIPTGDSIIGSDASGLVALAGALPKHVVLKGSADGTVSVLTQAGAEVLLNGVKLGTDPHPVLHGDKLMVAGKELLVVDPKRSGSTQYVNANDLAAAIANKKAGVSSAGMVNGRLVSLTDGREYAIGQGRATIGRDADCDVVIESKSVSRKHAEIMGTDKGYLLVDLSTNGTFVNGQKIAGQQVLARADVIRVGDADLRFYADPPKGGGQPAAPASASAPAPAPASAAAPAATPKAPEQALRETAPNKPPAPPPPGPAPAPAAAARLNDTMHGTPAAAPPPGPLASILVRSGAKKGQRIPIRVPVVNIGRAEYNDIVLAEESVSTQHAKLQRREGVWILVDLGSTNGTFVDGEKVSGETPVAPGSTIRFGDASVVFEPDDDALGIGKGGAGTKVMGALNVPPAAPKAAPAPAAAPAAKPAARPAETSAPRPAKPAAKRAPETGAPRPAPAEGGAPKWLVPVIALVVIIAVAAFFLLK
ncbi:MAG TPA: FHA domain-containing protein [Gemmatimonadales bacterium]|nr:FHA domain-containing protein [Gemmatimonadales bacterium]